MRRFFTDLPGRSVVYCDAAGDRMHEDLFLVTILGVDPHVRHLVVDDIGTSRQAIHPHAGPTGTQCDRSGKLKLQMCTNLEHGAPFDFMPGMDKRCVRHRQRLSLPTRWRQIRT